MKLKNVARYYDTCPVYDGYTGAYLFKVQPSTFLESSVEGSTSARRVISLAPELTPPAHSIILILGELTLLGAGNLDEWKGSAIRRAYWTKKVTGSFSILTPAEAVLGQPGMAVYGQRQYLKDTVNLPTESEYDPFWDFYFSASLPQLKGKFIRGATSLYRVRSDRNDVDGFLTAASDELELDPYPITFTSDGVYNPVTDSYTPSTLVVPGLMIEYYKVFERLTQADIAYQAGDMILIVAKSSTTPVANQKFVAQGTTWRILNVYTEQDAWSCHVRRG